MTKNYFLFNCQSWDTTTYKFLAECGLISDRHYNMLIVDDSEYESFDFESNENELLRKDLELNGIQIYTVKADVEKHRASKSIIYIKNLNVPENENDLISSLVSLLHKQGGYNRTIENSLTKLKLY